LAAADGRQTRDGGADVTTAVSWVRKSEEDGKAWPRDARCSMEVEEEMFASEGTEGKECLIGRWGSW
jgi:hypothetical protein